MPAPRPGRNKPITTPAPPVDPLVHRTLDQDRTTNEKPTAVPTAPANSAGQDTKAISKDHSRSRSRSSSRLGDRSTTPSLNVYESPQRSPVMRQGRPGSPLQEPARSASLSSSSSSLDSPRHSPAVIEGRSDDQPRHSSLQCQTVTGGQFYHEDQAPPQPLQDCSRSQSPHGYSKPRHSPVVYQNMSDVSLQGHRRSQSHKVNDRKLHRRRSFSQLRDRSKSPSLCGYGQPRHSPVVCQSMSGGQLPLAIQDRSYDPPRHSPLAHGGLGILPIQDRSRSRSQRGCDPPCYPVAEKQHEEAPYVSMMEISREGAAFVLGRGGKVKAKIEQVSGAQLKVHEKGLKLEFFGGSVERERARLYVKLVLAQLSGPVYMDFPEGRPDLSVVKVPEDCTGYIMGKKGAWLRSLEEEWGTLMVFIKERERDKLNLKLEKLAIFGPPRGRRGAELKVMAAVEYQHPGFFIDGNGNLHEPLDQPGDDEDEYYWGYETLPLRPEEISYTLGAQGSTCKKLARATGCIIQYVGRTAVMAGSRRERRLAWDCMHWLLLQKKGRFKVDLRNRDGCTVVRMPTECVGYITGHKGEALRRLEIETNTFCFIYEDQEDGTSIDFKRLLICGHSESARKQARYMVEKRVYERMDMDKKPPEDRPDWYSCNDQGKDVDNYDGRDRVVRGRDSYNHQGEERDKYNDRDRDRDGDQGEQFRRRDIRDHDQFKGLDIRDRDSHNDQVEEIVHYNDRNKNGFDDHGDCEQSRGRDVRDRDQLKGRDIRDRDQFRGRDIRDRDGYNDQGREGYHYDDRHRNGFDNHCDRDQFRDHDHGRDVRSRDIRDRDSYNCRFDHDQSRGRDIRDREGYDDQCDRDQFRGRDVRDRNSYDDLGSERDQYDDRDRDGYGDRRYHDQLRGRSPDNPAKSEWSEQANKLKGALNAIFSSKRPAEED